MTENNEYSMVMPFISLKSKGGPHDDESYVAGFEAGFIDATLQSICSFSALFQFPVTIHTSNRKQIDLIAMRHGLIVEDVVWIAEGAVNNEEWISVIIKRNSCNNGGIVHE